MNPRPLISAATIILGLLATSLPSRADKAENARSAATLKALSFSTPKTVTVASLAAPASREKAGFHGCALRSSWTELSPAQSQTLATALQAMITDEWSVFSRGGDADLVHLQPFGFVPGSLAVRLTTAEGARDFSVGFRPDHSAGYIYAYAGEKTTWYFTLDSANHPAQLRALLDLAAAQPKPASTPMSPSDAHAP